MRIQTLGILVAIMLYQPTRAQDSAYPTLAALANAEVPAFRYANMVDRMTWQNPNYSPPSSPPHYEVGDREWFRLTFGEQRELERMELELRGMTGRVLIWVQVDVDYPRWRANQLAQRVESQVLNPIERLFDFKEPPGVDGDPRLYIALIDDPEGGVLGYFPQASTRPQRLWSKSNQREMLVVNLALDPDYTFFDKVMIEVIAHEFLHILHYHRDYGEELWLDEAMASYAGYYAGKPLFRISGAHGVADRFLEEPNTSLTHWQANDGAAVKYGAGVLFAAFLVERFGEDIMARLLAEQANGWAAVEKVLREHEGVEAVEVFADWVLANYYLDSWRGYGYRALEDELTPPQPSATYNSFPATHDGYLPQFSTDYIVVDVRGAETLVLRLRQAQEAQLIDSAPAEGRHFYYGLATDHGNSSLTRKFDLTKTNVAWLRFKIWYDLEKNSEYGYVTISNNGGLTWETLSGTHTSSSRVYQDYYGEGFTGQTGNWISEHMNLSDYLPAPILLRFEVMSNVGTKYAGMAIDDLRIRAIGFRDGFEAPDDGWIAEGWIRSDNRLPNNTWLQAAQDTRDGLQVSRQLVSGNGELRVEILPGVSQVLVAVSPVVPFTSLPADYDLEFDLINAAGEIMAVSRECTVTTTHALNFRASPNGSKIGLVPKGAALDALDKEGDWFKVEHSGRQGWIHGDYVHTAGNCP